MSYRMGFIHGTGAAINVEIGWIPDFVMMGNVTDGDLICFGYLSKVIAFTSGGTTEIKPGDKITGLTNTGVYATIREVILDSGSWAGGDAAGWFIFNAEDMVGSFGSENAEVNDSGSNDVTVAAQTEVGQDIDDTGSIALATASGNSGIISYVGDADNGYAKGFTVGSTLSENGKLFFYLAMRNAPGESGDAAKVAGVFQKDGVW